MLSHDTQEPFRYGIFLSTTHWLDTPTEAEVFDNSVAYAKAAEQLGFDDVWLLEHHFTRYGLCNDTIDMAAYLLGTTRKIDVGTAIIQVPLHHPLKLAERVAMLDQLSHGRFICGIGRGQFPLDFEVFGQDIAESHHAMHEAWEVMEQAWKGRVGLKESKFWKPFQEVNVVPRPRSGARPRVYCAATSPSTVEWAAQRGIPMMLLFYLEDEVKKSNIELWSEIAAQYGYDPSPSRHVVSTVIHVADSTEQAREEILDRFMWWALEADATEQYAQDPERMKKNYEFHYGMRDEAVLRGLTSIENDIIDKLHRLCPIGSPEYCAQRLCEQAELLGTRHVVGGFEGVGRRERVIESMRRFQTEVVPQVTAFAKELTL
jgi:alkanal monooxygenase alpha chain